MRLFLVPLFLFLFTLTANFSSYAATVPPTGDGPVIPEAVVKKLASMKIKDIQKLAGRKLTLKEKILFLLLKHKAKRDDAKRSGGSTALTLGAIAIGLFIVGLFVPYVILGSLVAAILAVVLGSTAMKKDRSDRKAHAGKLMGWITLGLIGLVLILAAIVVSSWGY